MIIKFFNYTYMKNLNIVNSVLQNLILSIRYKNAKRR